MSKDIANLTPSQISGRLAKLHRLLEEEGLPWEAFQLPINDPEMRKRLVRFWASGGYQPTTTQKMAQIIMGKNFFDVEAAIHYFGVKPKKEQLQILAEVPFTEEELQEVKDTHILVAVFPLSILEIRDKVGTLLYGPRETWVNKEAFAKDRGKTASWQLVRKTPVPDSFNKIDKDQQLLLAKNEETPTARVMVYTIIGNYLATNERLFENICVRCQDLDSDNRRVSLGGFGSGVLVIGSCPGACSCGDTGLASSRKFQN